jgi:hypothetical protein
MSHAVFWVASDVFGCFACQKWGLRLFPGSTWMSQGFSMSKLMCQGVFWFKIDASGSVPFQSGCRTAFNASQMMSWGVFQVKIDVWACFRGHNLCLSGLFLSKWMPQGVFWVTINVLGFYVAGYFACQNWCSRVFPGSQLTSQGIFWVAIDVSGCLMDVSRCLVGLNWCTRVFSGSQLTSLTLNPTLTLTLVKLKVPGCSFFQNGWLTVFSCSQFMSWGFLRFQMDVPCFFPFQSGCPRVLSGSQLMP